MGEVTVCCFGHIQNYRGGGGGYDKNDWVQS